MNESPSAEVLRQEAEFMATSKLVGSNPEPEVVPYADNLGDTEPAPGLPTIGGFVQLPQSWDSSAGKIQNLVEHACGGVGVLRSLRHEQRANHHHLQDWHYLYCVSGCFRYSEWSPEFKARFEDKDQFELRVSPGQMIFTPPMRNHVLMFEEDTVLISISKLSRQHAEHEKDVVRL